MIKIKYNSSQIKELEKNKYVKSCTSKNINFTKEFKLKALELDMKGEYNREIFKKFGFPEYIISSRIPSLSLDRWKRNIKLKRKVEEDKGRKKKEKFDISKMTKDEELEYLRAKVAYLEELKRLIDGNFP